MKLKFERNLLSLFILAVCLVNVLGQEAPPLSVLVPRLQQEDVTLESSGQQYHLRITLPDGSERDEVTELRAPGTPEEELHVMGTITNIFKDTDATSVVMYTADKNGYVVKYSYKRKPSKFELGVVVLKTAAG